MNFLIKNTKITFGSLYVLLSFGLGLGISSELAFFSFLAFGKYNGPLIFCLNMLICILLLVLNIKFLMRDFDHLSALKSFFNNIKLFDIGVWTFWLAIIFAVINITKMHPWGEWDAWAMWNLKTKLLFLSDTSWVRNLHDIHWHTHPDYPLFLPFMNIWILTLMKEYSTFVPLITTTLFTLMTGMLLYSGLKFFIKKELALISSCLILSHPYYIFLATAQYADILLSFYLLASIITLLLTLREDQGRLALLSGSFIGFMPFIKNEGIVMALIIISLTCFYIYLQNRRQGKSKFHLISMLLIGFLVSSLPAMIFKVFLAPSNQDILPNLAMSNLNIVNLKILAQFIAVQIKDERWLYIWMFVIFMGLTGIVKLFRGEAKIISLFFIFFIGSVMMIYLMADKADLLWWVTSSLRRIFYYLLPSILFLIFYSHWYDHNVQKGS